MAIFDDIAMLRNYANRESRFGHERMAQRAVEDQAAHNEKVTAALKRKFAAAARERGLSHGFVAAEGQLLRMLPWAARLHDLTILEPMGAYGRPRMSELLLGGATRHVFRNARRPALMNH
jgi:hypothetical protein